jgi:hypothetical protein
VTVTALNYVTIEEDFSNLSDAAVSGTVTFTPNQTVYASGVPLALADVPIEGQIVGGQLQAPGGGQVQLLATDNTGLTFTTRTGFLMYTVAIEITAGTATSTDGWDFFLPSSPATVDLYSLAGTPAP